jgi:membrane fusion protein, heavy metal efflux system
MTTSLKPASVKQQPIQTASPTHPVRDRLWPALQLIGALALTSAALVYLLWMPHVASSTASFEESTNPQDLVQIVGPDLLRISKDTPLGKKLDVKTVETEAISAPLLTVTGSVVAHLRQGKEPAEDRWQFSTPELLNAYTDWRKSNGDVELSEKQLKEIRELSEDRIATQKKLVERLRKLVDAGTDAPKDLAAEEGNLRQATIQGRKDVIEAETAVRAAVRNRAGLERLLSQAGADPHVLSRAPEGTTVVVADVPEAKLALVSQGQACEARFYAFPNQIFNGRVGSLAPTISKERRTLRVLFELRDTDDRLKPGMFADVGLATDKRDALMVSAEGVIHVGRSDYLLVGTESADTWRITEVKVGELRGTRVEILEGLKPGNQVIGSGAILLKPLIVQAVQSSPKTSSDIATPKPEKSGS